MDDTAQNGLSPSSHTSHEQRQSLPDTDTGQSDPGNSYSGKKVTPSQVTLGHVVK